MIIPETGPVVAKFYSKTCGPCKAQTPITKQVAQENPEVQFVGIDIHKAIETTKDYGVKSVPTLVFIKDGVEISRLVGTQDKKTIEENVFLLLE